MHTATLRRLMPSDWPAYKQIRLEALLTERNMFGSNFEKEAVLTDLQWQERLTATDRAFWALYEGDTCVGLTGIIKTDKDTANLVASYIHPSYRGNGLSKLLYEVRLQWAREQGIKSITVSHRAGNEASRRANRPFGFVCTGMQARTWPDGQTADEVFYKLEL